MAAEGLGHEPWVQTRDILNLDRGMSWPPSAWGAWWAMQGSNLRPHPCEGCALPLS